MRIFDPKELPLRESELSSYGVEEIKTLCEYFGNEKCGLDVKEYDMINGWHHIWNSRPHFVNNFPNINILINIALLVPLSNANVERVFSQHKLTKTKLRNRMNVESLESHLMILLNAPNNIEDFNWNKAFDQWEKEQVRRVNQN
ncbi:unnamed protein product [Rhizophagus irregularis]|uniref:HAT C-terminal dimerisation domain-containing protein n=1 Tax=Rhizophagus irregularis TaxID=588596 RepID=A0A2I1HPL3_9GLOM|nr:hypothetical protein RhiirA4_484960 [Rhizophagus irregularis]CAB4414413.1 unnamed protein product [Rhizophagus irregularis]